MDGGRSYNGATSPQPKSCQSAIQRFNRMGSPSPQRAGGMVDDCQESRIMKAGRGLVSRTGEFAQDATGSRAFGRAAEDVVLFKLDDICLAQTRSQKTSLGAIDGS